MQYNSIVKEATLKGLKEGLEQGIEQGEHKKALETAKKMIKDNLPLETISKYTGLTLKQIELLK